MPTRIGNMQVIRLQNYMGAYPSFESEVQAELNAYKERGYKTVSVFYVQSEEALYVILKPEPDSKR